MISHCAHKRNEVKEENHPGLRRCGIEANILDGMAQPKLKRGKSIPEAHSEVARGFLLDAGCVKGRYSEFGRRLGYTPSAIERFMKGGGASADMIDAIRRRMKIDLSERIKAKPVESPNLKRAIENLKDSISPEAIARVRYREDVEDMGIDPPVEWWSRLLNAEQTIVGIYGERGPGKRGKK